MITIVKTKNIDFFFWVILLWTSDFFLKRILKTDYCDIVKVKIKLWSSAVFSSLLWKVFQVKLVALSWNLCENPISIILRAFSQQSIIKTRFFDWVKLISCVLRNEGIKFIWMIKLTSSNYSIWRYNKHSKCVIISWRHQHFFLFLDF